MPECTSRRQFVACLVSSLAAGATARAWGDLPIAWIEGIGADDRRYPIPAGDSVNIDRVAQVIIVRSNAHAYAFALSCPHESAAVKWVEKDHRFQCTKHDSRYQADGTHISGRATRNMDRFPIRKDGDSLVVTTTMTYHSDLDPKDWAAAVVDLGTTGTASLDSQRLTR
jgi:Rieske Fe-S protein